MNAAFTTLAILALASPGVAQSPAAVLEGKWVKLQASQIRSRLIGQTLFIDLRFEQAFFPQGETFISNGYWEGTRENRMAVYYLGRWTIVNDQICVEGRGVALKCRDVWTDEAPDRFVMESAWPDASIGKFVVFRSKPEKVTQFYQDSRRELPHWSPEPQGD